MNIREVKYLSYSGFKLFEQDPEGYYRRYLTPNRPPRDPQNHYMAIGSAFDAFVKADLHKEFVNDGDAKYTKDALFETQVEAHNRDVARQDGMILYSRYKALGAYDALRREMKGCINPRFESEITAELEITRLPGSIQVLGKPDVQYVHREGARVVHDFKCQGYYSKSPPSPNPGFLTMLNGEKDHGSMHKSAMPRMHKGFMINGNAPLHLYCSDWAEQLTIYAWSLGCQVGDDYILSIDQILSNKVKNTSRVARHAAICTDEWQNKFYARLHRCWQAVKTGHVFLNLPYDQSVARCQAIDAELAAKPDDLFIQTATNVRER